MRALVVLILLSAAARAEGPPDVIQLHDGTLLQGRLTEWRPDSHAIIVLLNGESRSVEWSDIEHASGPTLANASIKPWTPTLTILPPPPVTIPPLVSPTLDAIKLRQRRLGLIIAGVTPTLMGTIYVSVGSGVSDVPALHDTFIGLGSVLLVAGTALGIAGACLYAKKPVQLTASGVTATF
jgi:hypothetical protein